MRRIDVCTVYALWTSPTLARKQQRTRTNGLSIVQQQHLQTQCRHETRDVQGRHAIIPTSFPQTDPTDPSIHSRPDPYLRVNPIHSSATVRITRGLRRSRHRPGRAQTRPALREPFRPLSAPGFETVYAFSPRRGTRSARGCAKPVLVDAKRALGGVGASVRA